MNHNATNIQSYPVPVLWRDDPDFEDVGSFWQLTNAIGLDGSNIGPQQTPAFTFAGTQVDYTPDTTRGAAPGAAVFNVFDSMRALDGGAFVPADSFTLSIWVKLTNKSGSVTILGYNAFQTIRYELIYDDAIDRFVWAMQGNSGIGAAIANTLGSPAIEVWYWIAVSYDAELAIARIRIAATRTTGPLTIGFDTATVPGGFKTDLSTAERYAGYLFLGNANWTSLTKDPSELNAVDGQLAALGFWNRLLNDIEAGRINRPEDYPFDSAYLITEAQEYRTTESGQDFRITE